MTAEETPERPHPLIAALDLALSIALITAPHWTPNAAKLLTREGRAELRARTTHHAARAASRVEQVSARARRRLWDSYLDEVNQRPLS